MATVCLSRLTSNNDTWFLSFGNYKKKAKYISKTSFTPQPTCLHPSTETSKISGSSFLKLHAATLHTRGERDTHLDWIRETKMPSSPISKKREEIIYAPSPPHLFSELAAGNRWCGRYSSQYSAMTTSVHVLPIKFFRISNQYSSRAASVYLVPKETTASDSLFVFLVIMKWQQHAFHS